MLKIDSDAPLEWMRAVVTPTEMAAIDAEAPEPVEELIERAGWATARAALDLLGRAYGTRIAVLAGKGNNGADGRSAVPHLRRAGAHCTVFDVPGPAPGDRTGPAGRPEPFDLIIDACYGTGLRRPFDATDLPVEIGATPVLAVDIPSGVDGATGQLWGTPVTATATVTFAAPKPGLLLWPGRNHVGRLTVADIGLDCSRATVAHLGPDDLTMWPIPRPDSHKWRRAVAVIGGGPGMGGAPRLTALAALRAGAGYTALSIPGSAQAVPIATAPTATTSANAGPGAMGASPIEAVEYPVGPDWADESLAGLDRFGAAVVGPGLSETVSNRAAVMRWWAEAARPTVFDAGALACLAGGDDPGLDPAPADASAAHVVTPHEGEFARLTGRPPGQDRLAEVRQLAAALGVVVLLKGPTTVVAGPDGRVLLSTAGDARLATAGTGDVLAGIIGAGLAGGLEPLLAAGLGAELHGHAARRGLPVGLLASDLPGLVAETLSDVLTARR